MASWNSAESLPRLHLVALEKVSAPGANPPRDAAGHPEPGSGSLAGTGAVIHLDPYSRKVVDTGYPLQSPKHPDYHSTHADIWDLRERG